MKRDISSRSDIERLVNLFYSYAMTDPLIKHFFTDVVELDLDHHLPRICDFWEGILLDSMKYKGNPMLKHIELHQKSALEVSHFDRWLNLWKSSVDELFVGEKAEEAISRADQIALLMQNKIKMSSF